MIARELHVLDVRDVLALPMAQLLEWADVLTDRHEAAAPKKNTIKDPKLMRNILKARYGK